MKGLRHNPKHLVAIRMPVAIIDMFEIIDIHDGKPGHVLHRIKLRKHLHGVVLDRRLIQNPGTLVICIDFCIHLDILFPDPAVFMKYNLRCYLMLTIVPRIN